MRINFHLEYQTTFGEELMVNILTDGKPEEHKMGTLDGLHWSTEISKNVNRDQQKRQERWSHRLLLQRDAW